MLISVDSDLQKALFISNVLIFQLEPHVFRDDGFVWHGNYPSGPNSSCILMNLV